MSKWCCICDKRGHNTAECWYKKNFLKEINREGGKWKKKYTLPISSTPNKGNEYRKEPQHLLEDHISKISLYNHQSQQTLKIKETKHHQEIKTQQKEK